MLLVIYNIQERIFETNIYKILTGGEKGDKNSKSNANTQ